MVESDPSVYVAPVMPGENNHSILTGGKYKFQVFDSLNAENKKTVSLFSY